MLRKFLLVKQVVDKRMIELMNQCRQVAAVVHRAILLVGNISHDGKDFSWYSVFFE